MENIGTKVLETDRVILRKAEFRDIKFAFENWMKDREVTKYLSWNNHITIDDTKATFIKWIKNYRDTTYHWIIELKNLKEPIGTITCVEIDERLERATIGYCIGKNWWNKGLVTESLKIVIEYLFTEVGVNRIEAFHDVKNIGSGRVMEKVGMKREGILRDNGLNNQGIHDEVCYSILYCDYKKS